MRKIAIVLLLVSQVSLFAQDYKFGKVSKEELQETFYPLDSTADAAYLYRNRRTYYQYVEQEGDFQVVTEVHERIKIYTKEGFNMATKSIVYYNPDHGKEQSVSSIKGYTYSLINGKIEKEKLNKNSVFKERKNRYYSIKKITMPNIKEGVVIEVRYKLISPYSSSINDLHFQYGIPVKKLDYQVEIPEYYIFNKRSTGHYVVEIEQSSKPGYIENINYTINIFKFTGANIPALKDDEPFVANIKNYRGAMKFELSQTDFIALGGIFEKHTSSWSNVSQQIFKTSSFGEELNKSSYYKEDLEKILAVAKTDSDKIGTIFQFVKAKVKWNGYRGKYTDNGVRKAFKERAGNVADINLILTAMLRSAGLNANPVLISTRGNGIPIFPTLNGFNYVISLVTMPDDSYVLLDATEEYSVPNMLPVRVLNWQGRVVTKDGGSFWVQLPSSKHTLEENTIKVKISDDFIAEGVVRTKFDNLKALNFRNKNNHLKEENLITQFEEDHNLEVENFKITNQESLDKPVIRNIKFTSEDLVEEINGKIYIEPLLFLTAHKNPFKLEDRKFPVDFATPWKEKNTVFIELPKGYKVATLPASFAIGLPDNMGVFRYKVAQAGNTIKTTAILQFNSAIIGAENYQTLKLFYGDLVKKQSEKIVLVKE